MRYWIEVIIDFFKRIRGNLMGVFVFEGKNVINDLKYIEVAYAIIKGYVIEITTTSGVIERIPMTTANVGQLVSYCVVYKLDVSSDLEVIEYEIEESKSLEVKRNNWRQSKGLDVNRP